MKRKAILFLLIISSFCMNITGAFAAEEEEAAVVDVEQEDMELSDTKTEIMFALDIMEKDADDHFALASTVTRMEFTRWLYRMFNYESRNENVSASREYFNDVGKYHYGAGIVEAMYSRGIIKGHDDGMFMPENNITFGEACSMLIAAVGNGTYAYSKTPAFVRAHTLGIADGVAVNEAEALTRADAARLLYNLMYTEVEEYRDGGDKFNISDGDEFIRAVMKLDYADGIAEAAGGISLYNESITDGVIKLSGEIYTALFEADESLLGMHGRIFTDIDGENAVLFYPTKNDVVEVKAENVESYSGGKYSYYNDSNKLRRISIASDFDIVYNGYYSSDVEKLVPQNGTVRFINNDEDGDYDVAIVCDYQSYVVKSVASDEIIFENKSVGGQNAVINTKNFSDYILCNTQGKELELSSLSNGDVLTVIRNSDKYLKLICSKEKVTGVIDGISYEDQRLRFKTDGQQYTAVTDCYKQDWNDEAGVNVTIRLDAFGYVAAIIADGSKTEWKYGYIMKVIKDTDEEKLNIKLFTDANKTEIYECAEKIRVDGVRANDYVAAYDAIYSAYENFADNAAQAEGEADSVYQNTKERMTTRMVRYRINADGKVAALDTPERQSIYDSTSTDSSADNCFLLRAKGKLYYNNNQKQIKQVYNNYLDVPGEIFAGTNTKFFIIPEESNTDPTDDDYGVVTSITQIGFNVDGEFAFMSGYNCSNSDLECNIVVVRKNKGASANQRLFVFESSGKCVDKDEDVRVSVSGYYGNNYNTYILKDDSADTYDVSTFKRGDVLLCEIINDELVINNIAYNSIGSGFLNNTYVYSTDGVTHFNSKYRVLKAKAGRVSDGIILLDLDTDERYDELVKASSVIVIEPSKSKAEAIYKETVSNLKTVESSGEDADTILVSSKSGNIYDVVVIRNQ